MIGGENVTATNEEKILQLLEVMQADISGLKTDVAGLKTDVAGLKCREADRFPLPKIM